MYKDFIDIVVCWSGLKDPVFCTRTWSHIHPPGYRLRLFCGHMWYYLGANWAWHSRSAFVHLLFAINQDGGPIKPALYSLHMWNNSVVERYLVEHMAVCWYTVVFCMHAIHVVHIDCCWSRSPRSISVLYKNGICIASILYTFIFKVFYPCEGHDIGRLTQSGFLCVRKTIALPMVSGEHSMHRVLPYG
jgi:hypothetical protein